VEQRIVIKFLVGENVPSAEIHHRLQQQYGEECLNTELFSGYIVFQCRTILSSHNFSNIELIFRHLIFQHKTTLSSPSFLTQNYSFGSNFPKQNYSSVAPHDKKEHRRPTVLKTTINLQQNILHYRSSFA